MRPFEDASTRWVAEPGADTQWDRRLPSPREPSPTRSEMELEMGPYTAAMREIDKGKQREEEPKARQRGGGRDNNTGQAKKKKHVPKADKPEKAPKAGRKPGAVNYSQPEIDALLKLVSKYLPLGPNTWLTVTREYSQWCTRHGFKDDRDHKSVRTKFAAVCPPFLRIY